MAHILPYTGPCWYATLSRQKSEKVTAVACVHRHFDEFVEVYQLKLRGLAELLRGILATLVAAVLSTENVGLQPARYKKDHQ
jgi:hypothetical protein